VTYPSKRRPCSSTKGFVGNFIGKLEVICKGGKNKRNEQLWNCKCSCGNATTASTSQLVNGQKKSCGCLNRSGNPLRGKPRPSASLGEGIAARNKLIAHYKRQAKSRGYLWNLSQNQCLELFAGDCYYCGCVPAQKFTTGVSNSFTGAFVYNGIDRWNNDLGYEPDNVVSCCGKCNEAKSTLSGEDFIAWVLRVHHHLHSTVLKREAA
jgi:hypothetical protein